MARLDRPGVTSGMTLLGTAGGVITTSGSWAEWSCRRRLRRTAFDHDQAVPLPRVV